VKTLAERPAPVCPACVCNEHPPATAAGPPASAPALVRKVATETPPGP